MRIKILCFICGGNDRLQKHHIKPRSDGGSEDSRNIIIVCNGCHDDIEGENWDYIWKKKQEFITRNLPIKNVPKTIQMFAFSDKSSTNPADWKLKPIGQRIG